jgi:repressor LexA
MSDISERIMSTIKRKHISYGELSNMTGIAKSALQRYATGETEKIPLPRLEKIADALCVSAAYLMGWEDSPDTIPTAENIIPMPKMHKIPLIGTIACGTPILAVENIEDEVDIPEEIHADFALRCKGDSMIDADIHSGDIVYIRQQDEVDPGQIAAVLVEDEATLKRFYYDEVAGVVTLVPANSAMPPQVYQGETLNHIKILGLAVGLTRSLKGLNYTCI